MTKASKMFLLRGMYNLKLCKKDNYNCPISPKLVELTEAMFDLLM